MNDDSMQRRVTSAPMLPLLVRLSVPNVLSSFTWVIMIVVDGIILGKMGDLAVAAAATVLPLFMMLLQIAGSSYSGTVTAFVSKALGAQRVDHANTMASYSLILAIVIGLVAAALFAVGAYPVLRCMSGNLDVLALAYTYGSTLFIFAPFIFFSSTVNGLMRAEGNMSSPAKISFLTALVHAVAVFSLLSFGRTESLRIELPAFCFGGAFLVASLWQLKYISASAYKISWPAASELHLLVNIFRKSLSAATIPLIANGTALLGAYFVGKFGFEALAAYSVGIRLEYLVGPIAFGVGLTLLTVVSMNEGARLPRRVRSALWTGSALSAALILLLTAGGVIFAESGLRALGLAGQALTIGISFVRTVCILYFSYAFGITLFFGAQALGRPELGVLASGVRLLILAIGGLAIIFTGANVGGLFGFMAIALVGYSVVLLWALRSHLGRYSAGR